MTSLCFSVTLETQSQFLSTDSILKFSPSNFPIHERLILLSMLMMLSMFDVVGTTISKLKRFSLLSVFCMRYGTHFFEMVVRTTYDAPTVFKI